MIAAFAMCSLTVSACSSTHIRYPGTPYSVQMFVDICGAARRSDTQVRKAYSRYGYQPRQHNDNAFTHPEWNIFGDFHRSEGGPVKRRDGTISAVAKPSTQCEMQFTLPIVEGCSGRGAEQQKRVADFRRILGRSLGPDRNLNNINSRGVYVRSGGGGQRCIRRISATVWFD